jgi:hypothetical protein
LKSYNVEQSFALHVLVPEKLKMCCSFVMCWHAYRYCLGTVLNTFAYEEEKQLRLQCQSMLAVAKNIFSHLGELQLYLLMKFYE